MNTRSLLTAFAFTTILSSPALAPWISYVSGLPPSASNPGLPWSFTGKSGEPWMDFVYGSSGAGLPVSGANGYHALQATVFGIGDGTHDTFMGSVQGISHLVSGSHGIALGVLGEAFNDGTWIAGGGDAGAIGGWFQGISSRGGEIFGAEFLSQVSGTTGAGIVGIEVDTNATVDVNNKYGVAINSDQTDLGSVTGTNKVAGSGATVKQAAAITVQGLAFGATYPYILRTIQTDTGFPPIPSAPGNALWRAGGFPTDIGLDWSDLTCTTACLDLTGLIRIGAAARASSTTDVIAFQNRAAVDDAAYRIALRNYFGSDIGAIDLIGNGASNFKSHISLKTGSGGTPIEALLLDGDQSSRFSGHIRTSGTTPALSSCGTSPSISGTDTAGEVTMGTGKPIGCTITFVTSYAWAPFCTVTWQASPLASQTYVISASAITPSQTATSSNKVNYQCVGRSGG